MQRTLPGRRLALLLLALALLAGACSGGGGDDATDEDTAAAEDSEAATDEGASEEDTAAAEGEVSGGTFSMYLGEPETLISTNTNESEGGLLLRTINSALVKYAPEDGASSFGEEAPDAIAADIVTEDSQNYTITLKEGWTFHDGTPVTAQSFIDAWNYAAFAPNAQNSAGFSTLTLIDGYADLQCPDPECAEPPTAEEMSGLSAPDELTLEVALTAPSIEFQQSLGYTVFYALPEVFFEDPDAFNEQPIGTGPYALTGPWEHNVGINVERYEDYPGTPGQADAIEFRIYDDANTGYNDLLGGNLDVIDQITPENFGNVEGDLGERYINVPSSVLQFVGFPTYDPRFENPDIRRALSMAIPREDITETIFAGTRVPADSFISPVIEGRVDDACGMTCEYDPEAAAELYTSAGGTTEPMTMLFNSGAGHDQWITAIANAWQEAFGITEITFEQLDFSEYGPLLEEQRSPGPYRLGWSFDFPSMENYLTPLAGTGSSSNYTGYSNPEFDELLSAGQQSEDREGATEQYLAAEQILVEEVPFAPVMFSNTTAGYSENVDNVVFNVFGEPELADVTVINP